MAREGGMVASCGAAVAMPQRRFDPRLREIVEKKRDETETRAGSLPEALREGIDQLEERSET